MDDPVASSMSSGSSTANGGDYEPSDAKSTINDYDVRGGSWWNTNGATDQLWGSKYFRATADA